MMAAETGVMGALFQRSCHKETVEPLSGKPTGQIPSWLQGTLLRVGSGLMEVGARKYNHVFDGLALLHRFHIQDGHVTYQNRFLQSDTYKANMKYNDIMVSQFGTLASPDPCKTIFERLFSMFSMDEATDNDAVNIMQFSDEFYACTETNFIWRIDPKNLESLKKVNVSHYVNMKTALAHSHSESDGTVYNMGSDFPNASYAIAKFPPKKDKSSDAFERGSIIGQIPFSSRLNPSYYHSFGMTENYFIFVEQPLYIPLLQLKFSKLTGKSLADCMSWDPKQKTRLYVVRREDGAILPVHYTAEPFFVFHHINAYEEDGCLIVDMCCYNDGSIVKSLYVEALEKASELGKSNIIYAEARRYVLPLEELLSQKGEDENLLKGRQNVASAYKLRDGTVICHPQILTGSGPWNMEMPRINYSLNGKKYKYTYGVGVLDNKEPHLIKVDVDTGAIQSWSEANVVASEPVFVPNPSSKGEDGGVVIASLLYRNEYKKVSLLILDAKNMKEIARTNFEAEGSVPGDLHGIFVSS